MKRIVSFLLAIMMAIFVLPTAEVKAETEWTSGVPSISISARKTELQGTPVIAVTASISDYSSFQATQFDISYNTDSLSYRGAAIRTRIFDAQYYDVEGNIQTVSGEHAVTKSTEGTVRYVGHVGTNENVSTVNGQSTDLFVVYFNINENAEGKLDFTVSGFVFDGRDGNDNVIVSHKSGGTDETVTPATPTYIETTSIAITGLTTPVKGEEAVTSVSTNKTGLTGNVTWSPDLVNGKFAASTAYTATVTVAGGDNYKFADSVTTTLDGSSVSSTVSNNMLTVSKTFDATEAKSLTSISVSPETVSFVAKAKTLNDVLDNVTVTGTYDDSTTETLNKSALTISAQDANFNAIGTYTGTISVTGSTVASKNITINITGKKASATYNGATSITYDGTDKKDTITGKAKVADGDATENGNVTYTIKKKDGESETETSEVKEVGTYVLYFRLDGRGTVYNSPTADTEVATITITAKDGKNSTVTLDPSESTYDGEKKTPTPTVKDGDTTLTNGTDYNVEYGENKNAGENVGQVIINFIKNFTGSITKLFSIGQKEITVANVNTSSLTDDDKTKVYDKTDTSSITKLPVNVATEGGAATGDTIYVKGTAKYNSADAGTSKTITFTGTEVINSDGSTNTNYKLANSFTVTISGGTITKAPATDTTVHTQYVAVSTGEFQAPVIAGLSGRITDGITYTYKGPNDESASSKSYDEIVAALKQLSVDRTATINYFFENTNYQLAGTDTDHVINVTMADVVFTVQEGAITLASSPTYGMKWNQIVTLDSSKISAKIGDTAVDGTYSLVNADQIPDAGSQGYTIQFVTNETTPRTYTVTEASGTVAIAQKAISSSDLSEINFNKTYDGTTTVKDTSSNPVTSVTVKSSALVEKDRTSGLTASNSDASIVATYASKDAGTRAISLSVNKLNGTSASNYVLAEGATATGSGTINAKVLEKNNFVNPTDVSKTYDGKTTTGVTTVDATGLCDGDTATGTGSEAQLYDGTDAGTRHAKLTVTSISNSNYSLPSGGIELDPFEVTVNQATATLTNGEAIANQEVGLGVGDFVEPAFSGINSTSVTETIKYYVLIPNVNSPAEYTLNKAGVVSALAAITSTTEGYSIKVGYQLTNTNYQTLEGTFNVKIVDIVFTADDGAVTVKSNPTYGDSWSSIITINSSKIHPTKAGVKVTGGTYSVKDATDGSVTVPDAGEKSYKIVYTLDGKTYEVTALSNTVNVAKKKISSSNLNTITGEKTYDGTTVVKDNQGHEIKSVAVKSDALVEKDRQSGLTASNSDASVVATYASKDAGTRNITLAVNTLTGERAANYELASGAKATGSGKINKRTILAEEFTAPAAITDRPYDGTTTVKGVNSMTVSVIQGETVKATGNNAVLDSADAGDRTAKLTVTKLDNSNYELSGGSVSQTFDVKVIPVDATVTATASQETPFQDGRFEEPKITGVDGKAVEGTIQYSVNNGDYVSYNDAVAAVKAMEKTGDGTPVSVRYRFNSNNNNYKSSESETNVINLTIAGYKVYDATWTQGSNTDLAVTCTGVYEDNFLRDKFAIDSKAVEDTNVSFKSGSTIATLKASYLNTLSVGTHTIKFEYNNGEVAEGKITIKAKPSDGGSSSSKSSGSTNTDNVVTCQMAGYPSNYVWNEEAKACQAGWVDEAGKFHDGNRKSVANTSDTFRAFGWIASFTVAVMAAAAAFMGLKKWK